MADVSFHSEQTDFTVSNPEQIATWLEETCRAEGKELKELGIIFCSDNYLLEMNRKHLNHDYFTDIITFDYCEDSFVSGDLFISIDRIAENASDLNVSMLDELHRVIVHGVLHLIGYSDKEDAAKTQMTSQEDFYLSLRSF